MGGGGVVQHLYCDMPETKKWSQMLARPFLLLTSPKTEVSYNLQLICTCKKSLKWYLKSFSKPKNGPDAQINDFSRFILQILFYFYQFRQFFEQFFKD